MKSCPKCNLEIKISKFGTNTVEAKCDCQKARYFVDSGNDDDAREAYISKLYPNTKPIVRNTVIKNNETTSTRKPNIPISKIEEYFPTQIIPRNIQKNCNFSTYRGWKISGRSSCCKVLQRWIFHYKIKESTGSIYQRLSIFTAS
jgi:hypothetical protein